MISSIVKNHIGKLGLCVVILTLLVFIISKCGNAIPPGMEAPKDAEDAPALQTGPDPESGQGLYDVANVSKGEFRAVWVATVYNLDFPARQGLSAAALKREIDSITARTAELGLNAVVFQVRPTGDAFYQSDIFPWSQWLSGTQGKAVPDFDPLEYWIESCRANGLELHAWLNPYRIIHVGANSSDPGILASDNPVRLHPELAVGWANSSGNKGLFLDPGLPESRELIIDGVEEIIRKYDVDGIHIDDYFYPGTNFNDADSFSRYGGDMDLGDWRRDNVNQLIRGIGAVIRTLNEELGKNVRWGVSPSAIWMNGSNNPDGVPTTAGQESYSALYADTRRWVMEEWVDYICPQIYWYIGFGIADFKAVFDWWTELCKDYGVDLYIGHAAWREEQDEQQPHWRGETARQLTMIANSETVKGSVFYRYASLRGRFGDSIGEFYAEKDGVPARLPVMIPDTLSVGLPQQDMTVTAAANASAGIGITGTSLPDRPLYMNGEEITNRTVEGFFYVFAGLDAGINEFTFSQEGLEDVVRRVTRNTPVSGSGTPSPTPTVTQVTAPRYVTVTSDAAWVFPENTASGGSDWMMSPGQIDRIVAESSNGFVKLSSGMWIDRDSITLSTGSAIAGDPLRNGVYRTGTDHDMLAWQSDVFAGVYAGFDGRILTVSFGMHTQPPPLSLPDGLAETIFESVDSGITGGTPFYSFTISESAKFEGHYIEYTDGELRLHMKKRKTLTEGARPLSGITIVLDPGHGGEATGAIGPMGLDLPEKDIALIHSRKLAERLTALGASVHMTRDADADVSLQERVDLSRQIKPDLFISLHVNSVDETTNSTNVRGLSVWYRNPGSAGFAQTVLDVMYYINPGTNRYRNINQANFFVCRPQWAPAIILEASFIININDFVWLIDPVQQDRMADAAVDAILEYFGKII